MAKQGLTQEQTQKQRIALEQQRMLGFMLEKNDAEMSEFIDNKVNEIEALEKKNDDDGDDYDNNDEGTSKKQHDDTPREDDPVGENIGDEDTAAWYRYFVNNRSPDDDYYTPIVVSEKTLQDSLSDQLGELELDDVQLVIAHAIVGNLEDNGFLHRTAAQIADDVTFNDGYIVDAQQVEQMIAVVQSLDPPGIAARNVKECILLQLQRKTRNDDVNMAITIVDKYFDDFVTMRFDTLARKLGTSQQKIEEVFKSQIRRGLTPYPGNVFSSRSDRSQQVTPDFDVEIDEESNRLIVTLRNNIPALQISESYTLLNERYKSGATLSVTENKEKKVIIDAYQRASTFIELLKQRQQTLFATMNAIVKCQHDFFLSGDERDLKPLGQQQIADMIGKDVSVVSRAVNNKYVQLPLGVKSLKFFFREDINGASWHEVCDALKQLVEGEDKKNPLSDDALCKQLKEMGYQLERRTVAKYRDTLGIPSSPIRRKMAK